MCDYFPILRWIGYKGLEKKAVLLQRKRDEFLQAMVDEIREEEKTRGSNLIERLLSVQAADPDLYNDDVIKSILVVTFYYYVDFYGILFHKYDYYLDI